MCADIVDEEERVIVSDLIQPHSVSSVEGVGKPSQLYYFQGVTVIRLHTIRGALLRTAHQFTVGSMNESLETGSQLGLCMKGRLLSLVGGGIKVRELILIEGGPTEKG